MPMPITDTAFWDSFSAAVEEPRAKCPDHPQDEIELRGQIALSTTNLGRGEHQHRSLTTIMTTITLNPLDVLRQGGTIATGTLLTVCLADHPMRTTRTSNAARGQETRLVQRSSPTPLLMGLHRW